MIYNKFTTVLHGHYLSINKINKIILYNTGLYYSYIYDWYELQINQWNFLMFKKKLNIHICLVKRYSAGNNNHDCGMNCAWIGPTFRFECFLKTTQAIALFHSERGRPPHCYFFTDFRFPCNPFQASDSSSYSIVADKVVAGKCNGVFTSFFFFIILFCYFFL